MAWGALLWLGAQGALLSAVGAEDAPDSSKDSSKDANKDAGAEEAKLGDAVKPYHPLESEHGDAGARDVTVEAPRGARVLRVPIEGTIDLGIAAFLRRAIEDRGDASLIVLDVNTLGGRVDAAIQMRDALLDAPVKTVAYVHPRAISAGALISLACDVIAVAPGASIGAATPIQLGEGGGAKPVAEKMVSYFRTEMRTTAEAKGRRGDIAEAMVDNSVEIEGLVTAGKLLTLDTANALKWKIADLKVSSFGELLSELKLDQPVVEDTDENWAERVVRFLTDPVVSGLLMSLGTLGLLIELYSPGVGLPGAVGLVCIVAFFAGHLLVHLAGFEEILLFAAGLALMGAELFVIPGFGVAGVAGLTCLFLSLALTLVGLPLDVTIASGAWVEPAWRVTIALMLTVVGMFVALKYLPRTRAGRGLVLEAATTAEAGFVSVIEEGPVEVGQLGNAASDLRPAGIANLGDHRVDVVTEGDYVRAGSALKVVKVEGARIVVRAVDPEDGDAPESA